MNRLPVRTRIAPTPSGFLHIGNLYSFVLTWLIAKCRDGTVLLRIDDLDAARMRKDYLEDIFRTLELIGLVPDEGPSGVEDFLKNHSQVHRVEDYHKAINRLKEDGYLYACSCSRSRILADNPKGIYPGTCRNLKVDIENGEVALRIALPTECRVKFRDIITGEINSIFLAEEMGDFVVLRKDGLPAYQVASLIDDINYKINLVVRGNDLLSSTAAQLKLAKLGGFHYFSTMEWHHHQLIKNEQDQKLSKSAGAVSVKTIMEQGIAKRNILQWMASILLLPEKPYTSMYELQNEYAEKVFFT